MLAALIIVFREIIEAGLVVGIVLKRCCFVASENDRAAVRRNGFGRPLG
jgi:hypothetical protein